MGDLKIPVHAAFQKRLAELVWDNCPDLARQTAAGKLAMSIEADDPDIVMQVVQSLKQDILDLLKADLIAEVKKEFSANQVATIVDEVRAEAKEHLQEHVNLRSVQKIDKVVEHTVQSAADVYFGGNGQSFAKVIRSRVDALVDSHLKRRLNANNGQGIAASAAIDEGHAAILYTEQTEETSSG